ncbi:hypothetical protein CALVIDRAFT_595649 [Calocera viscosa TUFC12733]|uniref:Uncharacterized protein n=1 Tax=Calocera viscosa (strain TUFC12733) TaxID=1330018 RepID=A0A167QV82_CALVF|nr:hypothetical protein CALVIDRAFT_595649 [Calocera viscosa TUFC12733]
MMLQWERLLTSSTPDALLRSLKQNLRFVSLNIRDTNAKHQADTRGAIAVHEAIVSEGMVNASGDLSNTILTHMIDLGTPLKLVSSVIAADKRMQSVRCEVWDTSDLKAQCVAIATHTKIQMPWRKTESARCQSRERDGAVDERQDWVDRACDVESPAVLAKL